MSGPVWAPRTVTMVAMAAPTDVLSRPPGPRAPRRPPPGPPARPLTAVGMTAALQSALRQLIADAPLQELLRDPISGRVTGAIVHRAGDNLRVEVRVAVILATGGFESAQATQRANILGHGLSSSRITGTKLSHLAQRRGSTRFSGWET